MSFEVAGSDYDRFMGRYSRLLAPQLADFAGVASGQRVIDVGSGPGALTEELCARLGPRAVVAADPSAPFIAALRERLPGVEAAQAPAEALPFGDDAFDVALAQLAVHFMKDAVAGLGEKNVVLGGMRSPPCAVRSCSNRAQTSMRAACASPTRQADSR